MDNDKRLIEVAFPLKQVSLDSVHEKNVRHGHISTLHIWPARRPLAACRAALICTLLPDPGNDEERQEIFRRLAGKVVVDKSGKETTEGGILHWGRENGPDLEWFRKKIREVYGRPPRVLDPFAGGGSIPLEAMRLGCEATAIDINPVAWFILKCTLEYPHKLAGKTHPLPDFALRDREFMKAFRQAHGLPEEGGLFETTTESTEGTERNGKTKRSSVNSVSSVVNPPEADLAWHVRAWGRWVLARARKELAPFYPVYASFEAPADNPSPLCEGELRLVPLKEDGTPDVDALNAEFDADYLRNERNPRWVAKPTVAYLWARTVKCKGCRATVPLLKTQWLCKKKGKRVRLTMQPNEDRSSVIFGVEEVKGSRKFKRDGTMSRAGAICPLCGTIMTMEDLRAEGKAGRLGQVMTAVVVDGRKGKEYRLPTDHEREMARKAADKVEGVFPDIPFGIPNEPLPRGRVTGNSGFRVLLYGMMTWGDLFTPRQLLAVGTFVKEVRRLRADDPSRPPEEWAEPILGHLALVLDRLADYGSSISRWDTSRESLSNTFTRYALPMMWDYCEVNPLSGSTGDFTTALDWVARVAEHTVQAANGAPAPAALRASACTAEPGNVDVVLTDPPYYDAIAYSDCMDFFHVWLRRTLKGVDAEVDSAIARPAAPKWDHDAHDGELIEDESRFDGDRDRAREAYEQGMARAFQRCHAALKPDGRMGLVFANKQPAGWETLVSALVRAGFVVNASWPIETEMANRMLARGAAALSSSVWLVCRKRPETARPGWDNRVLAEMRERMTERLREFWDAGIRGPDFVWAATGPALEAYSKHPVVKKANQPNEVMTVGEFLQHVRRFVVDFQVGRVLSAEGEEHVGELDDLTTYYLLHRNDFGLEPAPAGAVILYALSCGISDSDLAGRYDLVEKSGSNYRLKPWKRRAGKNLGYKAPGNGPVPMVDMVHRLMHLWRAGDVRQVDDYIEERGLRRSELFSRVLQAIIELSPAGSEERSLLESISNHLKWAWTTTAAPTTTTTTQMGLGWGDDCPESAEDA